MIGLPKGMNRDDAYVQGIADTKLMLVQWIKDNPFVKEDKCWCDFFADYFNKDICSNCGHSNPHTYHDPSITSNSYKYCDALINVNMTGNEIKEAILTYLYE